MRNLFPSLRGVFGSWVYYPVLFSPEQINNLIKTSSEIRESKTLDDYLQRELTPNVNKILNYLNTEEDRFFNSIIVGVFDGVPDWLSLDISGINDLNEAQKKTLDDSLGILSFNGDEQLFAIDGQHRVEAIKRKYSEDPDYDDQVSVIFLAHADNYEGKKRTRRLFSDLNKTAQKVSAGELAIIDEQDIENIVARRIYGEYKSIPESSINLSKTAGMNVKDNEYFTNLLTIVNVCKIIAKSRFTRKKSKYSTDDINNLYSDVCCFWDLLLLAIPSITESFKDASKIESLRREQNQSYMRPMGLEILAEVYRQCEESELGHSFVDIISGIDLSFNGPCFNNITFVNKKVTPKNKGTSIQLILYKAGVVQREDLTVDEHFMSDELVVFLNS